MKEKDAKLEYATVRELIIELESRAKHLEDPNSRYLDSMAGDLLANLDGASLNFRPDDATNTK